MPSTQRTILVTGGAGFIGSHLVAHLLARGDRVVVVDDLSTGRRENLADCENAMRDGRLTLIEGRLLEVLEAEVPGVRCQVSEATVAESRKGGRKAGRQEGMKGGSESGDSMPSCLHASMPFSDVSFDAIFHLAAAVGVRLVVEKPIHTIEANVLETSALLRFADRGRTPTFLASTSEVYGKGLKTPFAEDDDVVYGATVHSRWSYACSKAIDEFLALAHHRERMLPVVIGRLFNTVGPRQTGEYGMVLPRFVAAALASEPLQVHGDGEQSRCFCDVRDVVPAIVKLLEGQASGEAVAAPIFNIGNDQSITIGELAETVKRVLDSDSEIVYVPYDQAFGPGFDDLRTRQPDLTRIRAAIDFQPSIPLEQTILDVAAEMTKNPEASRSADALGSKGVERARS
jgi:UDP-glucose 4-epimerase